MFAISVLCVAESFIFVSRSKDGGAIMRFTANHSQVSPQCKCYADNTR